MNRVNPKLGTIVSDAPKFSSITGFLPVLTYEFEIMVLFLSMYDLKIDIYLFNYKYQLSRIFALSIFVYAFCSSCRMFETFEPSSVTLTGANPGYA